MLLALGAICPTASAQSSGQTREWIWVGGSNMIGQPGVYGTLGVPAANNTPGAREYATRWTDSSGNWWFFGGAGYDASGTYGYLNDLWKLDASTAQWTWMGGGQTVPGGLLGQPGVYGTLGVAAAGNIPGGRDGTVSWTDAGGDLWLFGGSGFDAAGNHSALNDLWRFDPASGQWTWMGGSSTDSCAQGSNQLCGQPGVYGTEGVSAASNIPGGRDDAATWTDASGNVWLFGGAGFDSTGAQGYLSDLWKFTPTTLQWTWVGGSNTVPVNNQGQAGVYGTLGVAAAGNIPGGRDDATTWTDANGNLWLFGGVGADSAGEYGALNDLWKLDLSTGLWTWVSGTSTIPNQGRDQGVTGVYGTLGVPAAANVPGSREGANGWTDASGHLWLFGGYAFFIHEFFNDTWEFDPSTQEWTWMGGSSTDNPTGGYPGTYGTLGVPSASNAPGSRSGANLWSDASGNLWLFGGFGYASSQIGNDALNDLWTFTSNLQVAPTVTAAPSQTSVGTGQALSLAVSVAGAAGAPAATGTVTAGGGGFTSSATALSQGSATISIPAGSFSAGQVTLTVTYTPDANSSSTYKSATATTVISVATSTYSMTATALMVAPGATGTSTVTIGSSNGYTGTVTLTCAVTSAQASVVDPPACSVGAPVTLDPGAATATATVTLTTTAASSSSLLQPAGKDWRDFTGGGAVLALLFYFGFPVKQRRRWSLLGAALFIAASGCVSGCGGGGSAKGTTNPGTSAGTYSVTVTGTGSDAAATTATATFTLTVN